MAYIENRVKNYKTKTSVISLNRSGLIFNSIFIFLISFLYIFPRFFDHNQSLLEFRGRLFSNIINPFTNSVSNISLLGYDMINFSSLRNENFKLRLQVEKYKDLENKIKILETKNYVLSEKYKIAISEPENIIRAEIISSSDNIYGNYGVISAGSLHGVQPNNVIMSSNGYLLGRIVTVSKNFSEYIPINNFNSRIPVKSLDSKFRAILVGNSSNGGILVHLPANFRPKLGENLITSGDGKYYFGDIPVGKVTKVEGDLYEVTTYSSKSPDSFVTVLLDK